jgi:hypothetical protein
MEVTLEDLNETISDINSLYYKLKSQYVSLYGKEPPKYTEDDE